MVDNTYTYNIITNVKAGYYNEINCAYYKSNINIYFDLRKTILGDICQDTYLTATSITTPSNFDPNKINQTEAYKNSYQAINNNGGLDNQNMRNTRDPPTKRPRRDHGGCGANAGRGHGNSQNKCVSRCHGNGRGGRGGYGDHYGPGRGGDGLSNVDRKRVSGSFFVIPGARDLLPTNLNRTYCHDWIYVGKL